MFGKYYDLFVVLRYGRSCQELCGAILWVGRQTIQQLCKRSTPCIDDLHFKEEMKFVGELSQVWSHIVLKCLTLTGIGRLTWYCMVDGSQNGQKLFVIRFCRLISCIHHSFEYKQYCHVSTRQTMQSGTVSRLWLRRRSWVLKIHFWRSIVRFWKSYICSKMLDVRETNFSFTQFNRIRNYLLGRRIEIGRYSRSRFIGIDCLCLWKTTQNHERTVQPAVSRYFG